MQNLQERERESERASESVSFVGVPWSVYGFINEVVGLPVGLVHLIDRNPEAAALPAPLRDLTRQPNH